MTGASRRPRATEPRFISVNSSVIDFANTNGDGHGAGNLAEYNANFDWNLMATSVMISSNSPKRFGAEWDF